MRADPLIVACSTCAVPMRAGNVVRLKHLYDVGYVPYNFGATVLERAIIEPEDVELEVPFKLAVGWGSTANNTLLAQVVPMFCADIAVEVLWDNGNHERIETVNHVLKREVLVYGLGKRKQDELYRRLRASAPPTTSGGSSSPPELEG